MKKSTLTVIIASSVAGALLLGGSAFAVGSAVQRIASVDSQEDRGHGQDQSARGHSGESKGGRNAQSSSDDRPGHQGRGGQGQGHQGSDSASMNLEGGTLDAEGTSRLVYLIEEEKLAMDLYTALGETWDSRVFEMIPKSEARHQDMVEQLLAAYNIEDPRSSEPGVFSDPSLQALYDELLESGLTSEANAAQAGIAVELADIADLEAAIEFFDNEEIVDVLSKLLEGSRNHLAAFERVLNA